MSTTTSDSVSGAPPRLQDDFDNVYNAEWKQSNPIPDKYPRYTNFTALTEKMESIMKEICESGKSELVTRLYNMFLQQTEDQVKNHISGNIRPIAEITNVDALINYLCEQVVEGNYYLLHIYHGGTCRNPKFQIPHVSFGGLSMPDKSYYTERVELREDFEAMVTRLFSELGLDTSEVSSIWDIEAFIAEKHYSRAEKRDPLKTYHPCTMTQLLDKLGPQYNRLKEVLPSEYHDITLNNDELPSRFREVFNTQSLSKLQTWMYWKIVRSCVGSSVGELYNVYFDFYSTKLSGVKTPRPIEERAVLFAKGMLEDEFSRIYMNDYVDPKLVTEFPVFVERLRDTLREKITQLSWMSDATRAKAVEKLDGMTLKVVGPRKYEDMSHFNKEYDSIFAFADDYAKWDWEVLEVERKMYKLHDSEKWFMSAVDVNAYYHPFYNEIVFPAGILQDPFYSPDNEYGANAGGIGAVICHEMTHGFDDSGSKYDKDGYLHCWWTQDDRDEYEKVIKPMEDFFNSLSYQGTPLNGRLTQGENLADLGGLKCALASCPDDEQRRHCMVAWAKTWRANLRDEYAKQMITIDPHSLPHFRINGILPHIPDFYRLFSVNDGDNMYLEPEKRCNLWN